MKAIEKLITTLQGTTFSEKYGIEDFLREVIPAVTEEIYKEELKIADNRWKRAEEKLKQCFFNCEDCGAEYLMSLSKYCPACRRKRNLKRMSIWSKTHKEENRAKARKWARKNKASIKKNCENFRKKNPTYGKEYDREYRKKKTLDKK